VVPPYDSIAFLNRISKGIRFCAEFETGASFYAREEGNRTLFAPSLAAEGSDDLT
jgi:hypothetical protein